jgi:branched-chain amino acid aminotransferase
LIIPTTNITDLKEDLFIVCIFGLINEMTMNECFGNSFILNGELQPAELFERSMVYEGNSVYEVIRMIKGLPVFFSDHLERLEASTRMQKQIMPAGSAELKRDILRLVKSEKRKEINLKIVFNHNKSDNYLIYFIESSYPTHEQYKDGVKGVLFNAERKDPESKVIDHKLRTEIAHKLMIDSAYEALLVNKNKCITEGSRSNIFFIKEQALFTAPEDAVLSGITRKHIIGICRENGIDIELECIKADKIHEYESAIMTGTSPTVLPYFCIDNTRFNVSNPLILMLRYMYMAKVEESLKQFTVQ